MSTLRFLEIPLDVVEAFIKTSINESTPYRPTLARLLDEQVDLSTGHVLSTLPFQVGIETASTGLWPKDYGGLPGPELRDIPVTRVRSGTRLITSDWKDAEMTFVTDWLSMSDGGILTFWASNYDGLVLGRSEENLRASMRRFSPRYGLLDANEEVYHFATAADLSDPDWIWHHVSDVGWLRKRFLAVLSTLGQPVPERGTITPIATTMLEEIVRNLEAIIVGAYDGLGCLVWTRTQVDRWSSVPY